MKLLGKTTLYASVSMLAILTVPVSAQDEISSPSVGTSLDEIVITSTRREKGVQDVPASVQVLSGDTIDQLSLDSFEDILPTISGVGFSRSGSGATQIGIRGISNVAGTEFGGVDSVSPVGIYLDETPIQGGASLPDLALYDLQRVEVLKGPQGTLFGEGAMGGVIRFIPNRPNLSEYEAKIEGTVSATEHGGINYQTRGVVNIPVITDRLGARVAATYKDEDGYIDNVATGAQDINDNRSWSVRGIIEADLTSWLDVRLTYLHDETDLAALDSFNPNVGDLRAEFLENRFNSTNTDIFSGTVEADLGFATFSSITSYVDDERLFNERVDVGAEFVINLLSGGLVTTPVPSRSLLTDLQQEAFTQEIRLVSNGDNRLDWVIGGFYRDRDLDTSAAVLIPNAEQINFDTTAAFGIFGAPLLFPDPASVGSFTPSPFLAVNERRGPETFEQFAVYGEANFEVIDRLTATFGMRYFNEETTFDDQVFGFGYLAISSNNAPQVTQKEDGVLFKGGLDYQATDDMLVYFTASEGFRSGGGNLNAVFDLSGTVPSTYGSDSLWNYEAGVKSSWLEGRLIANASLYYLDWNDIQVNVTSAFVPTATGPRQLSFIDGASDARIIGGEIELTLQATDELSFGFNLNAQDSEFTSTEPGGSILPGTTVPRAPDITLSGFAQYAQPIFNDVSGFVRFDVQHTGSSLDTPLTDGSDLFPIPAALTRLDSYTVGNARIGLYNERVSFDFFVTNMWDERPIIGISPFFNSFQSGDFSVTTFRPRTFGGTLRLAY